MYLIHRPFGDTVGTWKAMEEAVKDGKIKSIGVCNHSVNQLKKILEVADIIPVVDQLECHPIFQAHDLRSFLEEQEIFLESWYPLGHGHKELLNNKELMQIAKLHNKSVSQVILRWHFQEGFVAIPKSTNLIHIKENIDILDFALTEEEMNIIRRMDTGNRIHDNLEDDEYGMKIINFRADI
jgi:diketogulonate reductase-like aldo/keto reductase